MARLPARASWIAATNLVALLLTIGTHDAAAQDAAAEALFTEGERLFKEGKLAEACDAFEASNRLEPRAGTLVNLGTCREQNGQLAAAWSAFKDALTRVKDPKKKKVASDRLKAIEPRLSYLTISVPDESRIDGLEVLRNGAVVDPALWNRAVPIDGGRYVIAGRAPGHEEWSTTVEIPRELGKTSVEVPRFKELARLVEPPPPPVTPAVSPEVAPRPGPEERGSSFTGRRKVALGVAGLGLVAVAGGVVLGMQAKGLEDDAFLLCPDPGTPCADAARANDLIDRGRSRALLANVSYGVAAGAAIGAAVLWLTGAPARPASRISITPRLGRRAGVDLQVRF